MQKNDPKNSYYQQDDVSLKEVLLFLYQGKRIILGITSLITAISIIYVLSVTPVYEATASISLGSDLSISKINDGRFRHENILPSSKSDVSKRDVYEMFIHKVFSTSFKEQVFVSNDYLEKLYPKTEKVISHFSIPNFVQGVKEFDDTNKRKSEDLITLSLKGENPLLISNFLNDLLEAANIATLSDIELIEQKKINSRIKAIEAELSIELLSVKNGRLYKINRLREELKIAKLLNNNEFSFAQITSIQNNSNNNNNNNNKPLLESLPAWYMYGEQALQQEIEKLIDEKKINNEKIIRLNAEKNTLSSIRPKFDSVDVVDISWSAAPKGPIEPKKRLIVTIAFFIALIISIFVVYLVNVVRSENDN
jgi:LPS O-antigen subunit length determinant protein (WzzB/FepE family)